jgi:hypothetical protein
MTPYDFQGSNITHFTFHQGSRNTTARHAMIFFFDIIPFHRAANFVFLSCTVYFFIFILLDVYLLNTQTLK